MNDADTFPHLTYKFTRILDSLFKLSWSDKESPKERSCCIDMFDYTVKILGMNDHEDLIDFFGNL